MKMKWLVGYIRLSLVACEGELTSREALSHWVAECRREGLESGGRRERRKEEDEGTREGEDRAENRLDSGQSSFGSSLANSSLINSLATLHKRKTVCKPSPRGLNRSGGPRISIHSSVQRHPKAKRRRKRRREGREDFGFPTKRMPPSPHPWALGFRGERWAQEREREHLKTVLPWCSGHGGRVNRLCSVPPIERTADSKGVDAIHPCPPLLCSFRGRFLGPAVDCPSCRTQSEGLGLSRMSLMLRRAGCPPEALLRTVRASPSSSIRCPRTFFSTSGMTDLQISYIGRFVTLVLSTWGPVPPLPSCLRPLCPSSSVIIQHEGPNPRQKSPATGEGEHDCIPSPPPTHREDNQ